MSRRLRQAGVFWALLAIVALSGTAWAQPPVPRAVVLVTIDTLRADSVSFAGYDRNTTPFLSEMAEDGVVLDRAYAPSAWTSPSMASLFTGLYPTSHGVTAGVFSRDRSVLRQPVLSEQLTTLAEAFQGAGWTTVGVPSNRHLSKELGFAQGFDHYLDRAYFMAAPRVAAKTREQLRRAFGREWPTSWKEQPVFLWIHFFDPHAPYGARQPWIASFAPSFLQKPDAFPAGVAWPELKRRFPHPGPVARQRMLPLYDSEIAFVDQQLELLADDLSLDDPDVLFVLTSDHGEEFADHADLGHGHTLYEELVRVPLLVRWPAGLPDGHKSSDVVGLHDLYPTLLELAGVTPPESPQAFSFVDVLRGKARETQRPAYFELNSRDGARPSLIGMTDGEWKVIRGRGAGAPAELYHLAEDPGEEDDLASAQRDRTRRLELKLRDWMKGLTPALEVQQLPVEDEELRKQLEALGYVGGGD